jgi:hypothetical protein
MVYSQAEGVFIRKRYFTSKVFATVCEVFTNVHTDREVLNKITNSTQLVTKFCNEENVSNKKYVQCQDSVDR